MQNTMCLLEEDLYMYCFAKHVTIYTSRQAQDALMINRAVWGKSLTS